MSVIKTGTTSTTGYIVESDTNGNLVIQTGSTPTTALTLNSNQTATFAQSVNIPNTFGFKNRIINGGMVIDQRNAGASVTPATGAYTLDRWWHQLSQASKISVQRSTTAPTGFTNSALITSLSAYSVGVNDYFNIIQTVEGFNAADFGWGTANAQTVTVSFWVRSSLTGTFGGSVLNNSQARAYPFTYTVSAANTWEQKSVTIPGDTSGTWPTDNTGCVRLSFGLGAGTNYSATAGSWQSGVYLSATGATSVVGTNGATFYITGVQLERGSTATSFDFRPYGTELALCQRYYYRITPSATNSIYGSAFAISSTVGRIVGPFPVTMRTSPTALEQSGTASNYVMATGGDTDLNCSAVPAFNSLTNQNTWFVSTTVASGLTTGRAGIAYSASTAGYLGWSAEL